MAERQMLVVPASVQRGHLYLEDRRGFDAAVARWSDCGAVLRIEEARDVRRAALNAYYWGVVLEAISEHTGHTHAEAHDLMKALHLPHRLHAMRGGAVCSMCARIIDGSTRQLSGGEEWRYIERIQLWASQQGIWIDDPQGVQ